jgi:hypothetical protein
MPWPLRFRVPHSYPAYKSKRWKRFACCIECSMIRLSALVKTDQFLCSLEGEAFFKNYAHSCITYYILYSFIYIAVRRNWLHIAARNIPTFLRDTDRGHGEKQKSLRILSPPCGGYIVASLLPLYSTVPSQQPQSHSSLLLYLKLLAGAEGGVEPPLCRLFRSHCTHSAPEA